MKSLYSGNVPVFDPQPPQKGTRHFSHYDSLRKDTNPLQQHEDDPFISRPQPAFTPNRSLARNHVVTQTRPQAQTRPQPRSQPQTQPSLDLPPHGSLTANQKRSYLEAFNIIGENQPQIEMMPKNTDTKPARPQSLYYVAPVDDSLLATQNHFDPIVDHPTVDTVKAIAFEACKNLWKGTSLLFFALRASVAFAYSAVYPPDTKRRRVSEGDCLVESDARMNDYLAQNAKEEGTDIELEIIGSRKVKQYPSRVPGAFVDHQYDDYYSKVAPEQLKAAQSIQEPPPAHLRPNTSFDESLNRSFTPQNEFPSFDQSSTPIKLPKRGESAKSRVPSYGTTFLRQPLEGQKMEGQKRFTERLYNAFSGNYKPPPTVVPETSFDASHLEAQDKRRSVFSAWRNDDSKEDTVDRDEQSAWLYKQREQELEKSVHDLSQSVYTESYDVLQARRLLIQEQIERQKALANGRPQRASKREDGAFLNLTEDQLKQVDNLWRSAPHNVIIDKFRIDIKGGDIQKLKDGRWLNDNVINFYFAMITERSKKSDGKLPLVGCMVTQFFNNLQSKGYNGVARWAKRAGIDVTKADYVFFPLNLNNNHWCLAVLDNVNKQLRQHDSLSGDGSRNLQLLKDYLRQEAEKMHPGSGKMFDDYEIVARAESPQQFNGVDCGVFTCQNAELMARNGPLTFSQEDMPTIRRRIVYEVCTAEFLTSAHGKL